MVKPLTLAVLLAVAGCGPLVQIGGNNAAPPMLLTLHADAVPGAPPAAVAQTATLLVLTPLPSGALQTLRLPVATRDTELQYLTGAGWSEQPNRLFRRVLADTIAASGTVVVDGAQRSPGAGRTLAGNLIDFGLDVRAAPVVRVRYDATLTTGAASEVKVRRFEATAVPASQTPGDVAAALNDAANKVAGEVAAWVK